MGDRAAIAPGSAPTAEPDDDGAIDPRTACFVEAYPGIFDRAERDADTGEIVLITHDGTRLPWHDGVARDSLDELLSSPSLLDTLRFRYPAGASDEAPPEGEDPGRLRNEPLMRALYGQDERSARAGLVEVDWSVAGRNVRFHAAHGAAAALARVAEDLERELSPEERRFVAETAGTFNWRPISGTDRMSAHAWGIAIDIGTDNADYWRWARDADGAFTYRNRIPMRIVHTFERHGFIWGGRWHHFDTMHFEYRPELLHPTCVGRDPDALPGD